MHIKRSHIRALAVLCLGIGPAAWSQVITDFSPGNALAWTNTVNTNALYSVEWASSADGPWYRTFQGLQSRDGHSNTSFTVATPMFYRVVMTTNAPPAGMVWIHSGESAQGQPGTAIPVHTNFVSGFWMDATEVTKELWDEVYDWAITNGFEFSNAGQSLTNTHPVRSINWYDAVKWCNARSIKDGLLPVYRVPDESLPLGDLWYPYKTNEVALINTNVNWAYNGYRLPTEAEWEKAARGGRQGRRFPWGGYTITHGQANYYATNSTVFDLSPTQGYHPDSGLTSIHTLPVGLFAPNAFGLYDMAGNVREWCWDYHATPYHGGGAVDPQGPDTGLQRIVRGGSWASGASGLQCAFRFDNDPGFVGTDVGFRCVRRP